MTIVNIILNPIRSLIKTVWYPIRVPLKLFFTYPFPMMSFHPKITNKDEQVPEYLSVTSFRFRGLIGIDMARCTGCRRCERVCPNKIIRMVPREDDAVLKYFSNLEPCPTNRKKVYPEIYFGRCLFCGYCESELVMGCPFDALHLTKMYDISDVYDDNLIFTPEKLQGVVERVGRGTQGWWTREVEKPKEKEIPDSSAKPINKPTSSPSGPVAPTSI